MDYFLFFVNILLTIACSTSVASAYFLNRVRGGKVFATLGMLFLIYFLDNTVVFMTEVVPGFALLYDNIFMASPVFKAVFHIAMVYCFIFIHKQILREKINSIDYVLLFIYAMVLFTSNFIPDGATSSWVFYAPTQIFNGGLAVYGLIRVKTYPKGYLRSFYRLYKKLCAYTIIMNILILLEDTYVIFNVDVYNSVDPVIFNRNISENIMLMGYAIVLMRYTRLVLKNRDMSVFGPVMVPPANVISTTDAFCHLYSLTDRERDVLNELLEGYSILEISERLYISSGTVKTHIHNLYRKTEVGRKSELVRKYNEFETGLQQSPVK